MNTQGRGEGLLKGGQRMARAPGALGTVFAGGFQRILGRIDAGLSSGSIRVTLPDGVPRLLGGRAPGFDAVVELHDWRALVRLVTGGSIGWYQAWEAGEWSSPDPVPLFALFMANGETLGAAARARGAWRWIARLAHWLNRNTHDGARRNIHAHYDLGNDFYATWLDPTMSYSSALFDGHDASLEGGQLRKWERLTERVEDNCGLSGKSVLEIGCGWGGLATYLAQRGAQVTAISLSDEQLEWARHQQLATIDFRKQDYRDVTGQFDGIVSVEMVEAVGQEYWPAFFDCLTRCLKPGGRAAIQFISLRESLFDAYAASADFIQAYVFPGGQLIRECRFRELATSRGLRWEEPQDFGDDYAATLALWRRNFDEAIEQGRLPAGFDARFINLWRYYLMYCEGGFRGQGINVSQVTLVKG